MAPNKKSKKGNVKAKQVQPKKKNRSRSRRRVNTKLIGMNDCSLSYAVSMNNPWTGPLSCIPTFPSVPSQKIRTVSRGAFQCNALGFGFIAVHPWKMLFSSAGGTTVDNLVSIIVNTPDASVSNWDFTTGTSTAPPFNTTSLPVVSPYDGGLTVGTISYRLVSAGIRIRYCGPLINRSGRFVSYRTRDDSNIAFQSASSGVLSFPGLASIRDANYDIVSGDWITCVYAPVQPSTLTYCDGVFVPDSQGNEINLLSNPTLTMWNSSASVCMGIALASYADNNNIFDYEVTANFEVVGRGATGTTRNGLADPQGASRAAQLIDDSNYRSSWIEEFANSYRPQAIDIAARTAGAATTMAAMNGLRRLHQWSSPRELSNQLLHLEL